MKQKHALCYCLILYISIERGNKNPFTLFCLKLFTLEVNRTELSLFD